MLEVFGYSQDIFKHKTADISKSYEVSLACIITIFEVSVITSNHCTQWPLKQVALTAKCMAIYQVVFGELSEPFKEPWISSHCLCNLFIQTAPIFYWHSANKVLHMVITQRGQRCSSTDSFCGHTTYPAAHVTELQKEPCLIWHSTAEQIWDKITESINIIFYIFCQKWQIYKLYRLLYLFPTVSVIITFGHTTTLVQAKIPQLLLNRFALKLVFRGLILMTIMTPNPLNASATPHGAASMAVMLRIYKKHYRRIHPRPTWRSQNIIFERFINLLHRAYVIRKSLNIFTHPLTHLNIWIHLPKHLWLTGCKFLV